jgi:hypothetical protein
VTATAAASCTATLGNNAVVLTATDINGATATANLIVNVTANDAPTLTYASPQSVTVGGSLNVSPTAASDNGTVSYQVLTGHGLDDRANGGRIRCGFDHQCHPNGYAHSHHSRDGQLRRDDRCDVHAERQSGTATSFRHRQYRYADSRPELQPHAYGARRQ